MGMSGHLFHVERWRAAEVARALRG